LGSWKPLSPGHAVAGRRIKRKQTRPSPEKVAGRLGWHSREIKPEKSEHEEGHIALGKGKSHVARVK
jgi:hypothetical protein